MPSLQQHVLGTGNVRKSWTYRPRLHVKAFTDKGDDRHGTGKKVGNHDFLSTACLTIEFLSKVIHFFLDFNYVYRICVRSYSLGMDMFSFNYP